MKQMWEKKKKKKLSTAAIILNVWKRVTPLGRNWLEKCFCPPFVHPLNGIKRGRIKPVTEIFLQWPRALSPDCLTFTSPPQGEVEIVMGTEWVLMQSRQKRIGSGEGPLTQQTRGKC